MPWLFVTRYRMTLYLTSLYYIPLYICKQHRRRWQEAWNIDSVLENIYIIILIIIYSFVIKFARFTYRKTCVLQICTPEPFTSQLWSQVVLQSIKVTWLLKRVLVFSDLGVKQCIHMLWCWWFICSEQTLTCVSVCTRVQNVYWWAETFSPSHHHCLHFFH